MMRIIVVHNFYQQWGGEDACAVQEERLLRAHGHDVLFYQRHNDEIKAFSARERLNLLWNPTWSPRTYREMRQAIRQFRPDLVHVHNFFPLVSPSVFYACRAEHTPVVLTLHDYRLKCVNGWMFRDHHVCRACFDHSLARGIVHGCYRSSRVQTVPVTVMIAAHQLARTWHTRVDQFIAVSDFVRRTYIEAGLPDERIVVRPNFLDGAPDVGAGVRSGALYVGRLSAEKGLETLVAAWRDLPGIPLTVVGDGPLRGWIEETIAREGLRHIALTGFVTPDAVAGYMQSAALVILPPLMHETFGRVVIEAFAAGAPVVASRLGGLTELVQPNVTGLLFEAGAARDLAQKVRAALSDPDRLASWGRAARRVFEERYTAEAAYTQQMAIYERVLAR